MSSPSPVPPAERVIALDAVRGAALFGVLLVNLETDFRISLFDWLGSFDAHGSAADHGLDYAIAVLLEGKAFGLFSLLFGAGLAVQAERWGREFVRRGLRRLIALLVIGVLHATLVWNGDILVEYAAVGLVVLLFARASAWVNTVVAVLLLVGHAAPLPSVAFPGDFVAHGEEARRVYADGTFLEIARYRLDELRWIVPLHISVLPRTAGLALLGAGAWRAGVLRDPVAWAPVLRPLAWVGTLGGLGAHATLAVAATVGAPLGPLAGALDTFGTVAAALGYGAALFRAFSTPSGRTLLAPLAPLGRMALTAYLTQSLVLTALFYGWGLGWFGRISAFQSVLVAIGIYAAQVVLATAWMARYAHGPVEAVRPAATYGRWPVLDSPPRPDGS